MFEYSHFIFILQAVAKVAWLSFELGINMDFLSIKVSGPGALQVEEDAFEKDSAKELIQVTRGGICGSDIHYYQHGGVGDFKLQHPMTLGHEVIGRVVETNKRVAINPSKPCDACKHCLAGESNQCLDMEFFGSAMRNPHVNGGFSQYLQVPYKQLVGYDESISDDVMAFSEPLAVAIHAVNQSGGVLGKRVIVTGCGPIGCLLISACKASGASEIVATDLSERCQLLAKDMGADKVFSPSDERLNEFTENKGYFDVGFEASGAVPAFHLAIDVVQAKGSLVLVGMRPGMVDFPLTKCLAKELNITGSFRFTSEFETSVRWLEKGIINPLPLLTKVMPFQETEAAIQLAADKTQSMKVQIQFEE